MNKWKIAALFNLKINNLIAKTSKLITQRRDNPNVIHLPIILFIIAMLEKYFQSPLPTLLRRVWSSISGKPFTAQTSSVANKNEENVSA